MRPIPGTVTDPQALQAAYKADEERRRKRTLAEVWQPPTTREDRLEAALEHLLTELALATQMVDVNIAAGVALEQLRSEGP